MIRSPESASPPGAVPRPAGSAAVSPSTLSWLPLIALLALGLNLRSPLTAIPPVITQMRAELGIDEATAGLLTSIPAFCFGVLTPLAALIVARRGVNTGVVICLVGAAIGLALRPFGGLTAMIGGTFLIGAALAIGNIMALILIARDFSGRSSLVTGLYTASLNIGTMITGALTAPLAAAIGWRMALASWVWLALLALLCHALAARRAPPQYHVPAAAGPTTSVWRRPIMWLLSAGFALHLFVYYGLTAWLPTYLAEVAGMSAERAGAIASTFQLTSLIGSFGVPLLVRYFRLGQQLAGMGLLWVITVAGILNTPHGWLFWSFTGGVAQGGAFVVLFLLIMQSAGDLAENRRLSATAQGIGYTLSALGPIVVGALHGHFCWTAGFSSLGVAALCLLICGVATNRLERHAQPS